MIQVRETIKADDEEITRNLMGLAKTRPDIFGSSDEEVTNAVAAEIQKELGTSGKNEVMVGQKKVSLLKDSHITHTTVHIQVYMHVCK